MLKGRTRLLLWGAAAVVLFFTVAGAFGSYERSKVVVQAQKVARADLVSIVSASGEVKPKRFVDIGANVSGRIVTLDIKEGDRVREGQILARIDSTRFAAGARQADQAVRAARADLDRAAADLESSRLGEERARQLHADRLLADQDFDRATADLKMKQANVESAKRRIAQLQAASESTRDDLEKTTVVSPMDGVITRLVKEEGEVVIGAQSFNPTVIMTVADLQVMECEIMVDETDIRHLKLGLPAEVRVDALEGAKIQGTVTEIGSSAVVRGSGQTAGQTSASGNTGNQAKDFKVTITLQNPPASLRPGLNATADIKVATREHVLAVPIQAVVVREVDKRGKVIDPAQPGQGPAESGPTLDVKARAEEREGVFAIVNGKSAFRAVKTGIMGDTDVEIVSGVSEGDEIVSGSYKTLRTLKDDARLKIEDPNKKPGWSWGPPAR